MFKKFRFFKRFKKLVFGGFAIICGAIACCLLGSWTYDSNNYTLVCDCVDLGTINTSNTNISLSYSGQDYNGYEFVLSKSTQNDSFSASISTTAYDNNVVSKYLILQSINNSFNDLSQYIRLRVSTSGGAFDYVTSNYIQLNGGLSGLTNPRVYHTINNMIIIDLNFLNPKVISISFILDSAIYTASGLSMNTLNSYCNQIFVLVATNKFDLKPQNYSYPLINSDNLSDYNTVYDDTGYGDYLSRNILNLHDINDFNTNLYDNVSVNSDKVTLDANSNALTYWILHNGDYGQISLQAKIESGYNGIFRFMYVTYTDASYEALTNLDVSYNELFKYTSDKNKSVQSIVTGVIPNDTTLYNFMINKGSINLPYFPYGDVYSQDDYYDLWFQNQQLQQQIQTLQNAVIDYGNYTVKLVYYASAQTTQNYTEKYTIPNIENYLTSQGFLSILNIYNDYIDNSDIGVWDGIVVESSQPLNVYNYNLLFNGSGSPNLDFALYYDYYDNPTFSVLSLTNIVGDSVYYGYFDLISLFGRNNITLNAQNVLYNKFAIHYTNVPSSNDLVNIKLNSADGYNSGYAQGQADVLYNVEELKQNYNELNNQYNSLESSYNQLHDRYENLANTDLGFSMSKLMWNIASTPFESFKSIWSVNFLDFNIASFITGILSIFVIVWLLKKIF